MQTFIKLAVAIASVLLIANSATAQTANNFLPATGQHDWGNCKGKEADKKIVGCTRVLQSRGETPQNRSIAFLNRGAAYHEKHDYDHALADYSEAIKLDPNNAKAFNYRGALFSQREKYDLAIKDFDEGLRLDPNNAPMFDSRGATHLKMGQFDKAIGDFDAAIQYGHFINSLYARGWAKLKKGDTKGGDIDIAAAKAQRPNAAELWDKYYGVTH